MYGKSSNWGAPYNAENPIFHALYFPVNCTVTPDVSLLRRSINLVFVDDRSLIDSVEKISMDQSITIMLDQGASIVCHALREEGVDVQDLDL